MQRTEDLINNAIIRALPRAAHGTGDSEEIVRYLTANETRNVVYECCLKLFKEHQRRATVTRFLLSYMPSFPPSRSVLSLIKHDICSQVSTSVARDVAKEYRKLARLVDAYLKTPLTYMLSGPVAMRVGATRFSGVRRRFSQHQLETAPTYINEFFLQARVEGSPRGRHIIRIPSWDAQLALGIAQKANAELLYMKITSASVGIAPLTSTGTPVFAAGCKDYIHQFPLKCTEAAVRSQISVLSHFWDRYRSNAQVVRASAFLIKHICDAYVAKLPFGPPYELFRSVSVCYLPTLSSLMESDYMCVRGHVYDLLLTLALHMQLVDTCGEYPGCTQALQLELVWMLLCVLRRQVYLRAYDDMVWTAAAKCVLAVVPPSLRHLIDCRALLQFLELPGFAEMHPEAFASLADAFCRSLLADKRIGVRPRHNLLVDEGQLQCLGGGPAALRVVLTLYRKSVSLAARQSFFHFIFAYVVARPFDVRQSAASASAAAVVPGNVSVGMSTNVAPGMMAMMSAGAAGGVGGAASNSGATPRVGSGGAAGHNAAGLLPIFRQVDGDGDTVELDHERLEACYEALIALELPWFVHPLLFYQSHKVLRGLPQSLRDAVAALTAYRDPIKHGSFPELTKSTAQDVTEVTAAILKLIADDAFIPHNVVEPLQTALRTADTGKRGRMLLTSTQDALDTVPELLSESLSTVNAGPSPGASELLYNLGWRLYLHCLRCGYAHLGGHEESTFLPLLRHFARVVAVSSSASRLCPDLLASLAVLSRWQPTQAVDSFGHLLEQFLFPQKASPTVRSGGGVAAPLLTAGRLMPLYFRLMECITVRSAPLRLSRAHQRGHQSSQQHAAATAHGMDGHASNISNTNNAGSSARCHESLFTSLGGPGTLSALIMDGTLVVPMSAANGIGARHLWALYRGLSGDQSRSVCEARYVLVSLLAGLESFSPSAAANTTMTASTCGAPSNGGATSSSTKIAVLSCAWHTVARDPYPPVSLLARCRLSSFAETQVAAKSDLFPGHEVVCAR